MIRLQMNIICNMFNLHTLPRSGLAVYYKLPVSKHQRISSTSLGQIPLLQLTPDQLSQPNPREIRRELHDSAALRSALIRSEQKARLRSDLTAVLN